MDVGRDHLIHRKRSPFPYEGKALTRPKGSGTVVSGAKRSAKGSEAADHLIHRGAVPLPLEGKDIKRTLRKA